jgi:N,N'-diacetyllegionaminate synthase
MKTIIIAEAGVNHNGSLDIAKRLIESASAAGANIIKFQTFKADNLVSRDAKQADYQKRNLGKETSQFDMLKDLELSFNDHKALVKHCKKFHIAFFSTAFDMESIILLESIKMPMWKIPSGEITNLPYIKKIGSFGKPVILSTGMATMGEIEAAIGLLEVAGTSRDKITVLHCTTDYPASPDEINLSAMVTIGNAFKVRYGYSDHSEGIEISLAAVAMGASVIEKHFTLDKKMKGPDHKASLEPYEMKQLIDGIRKVERAIGNGIKIPSPGEMKNKNLVRKSIVASRDIRKGEKFSVENITVKRPGDGLSPMVWEHVIGLKAGKSYLKDEKIRL